MSQIDGVALQQIFARLKTPRIEARTRAAHDLRAFLGAISRDLSSEQFNRYNNEINRMIFELLQSKDTLLTLGGIAALNSLIDFDSHEGEENATQTARFLNYLKSLILLNDVTIMKQAITTLGKLATPGGTLTAEFVDHEAKTAIEWLQSEGKQNETRRHAAVLIISALAHNAPLLLQGYILLFFDYLWMPLRDLRLVVRCDAAACLERCIDIVYARDVEMRRRWLRVLMDHALAVLSPHRGADGAASDQGLNTVSLGQTSGSGLISAFSLLGNTSSPSPESVHAALLVYRELAKYPDDPHVRSNFDTMYENTTLHKGSKYGYIRTEICNVFSLLVRVNREDFVEKYLHRTVYWYLQQLRKFKSNTSASAKSEKSAIFRSIGLISRQVGSQMAPYLDAILENIREGLASLASPTSSSTSSAAAAISAAAFAASSSFFSSSTAGGSSLGGYNLYSNAPNYFDEIVSQRPSTILEKEVQQPDVVATDSALLQEKEVEIAIFDCIGQLSIAIGPALTKHLQRDILDLIFAYCTLSVHMRNVLVTLLSNIPTLEHTINAKLLNLLSFVLSGHEFLLPGAPTGATHMDHAAARQYRLDMISRDTGLTTSYISHNLELHTALDADVTVQALQMLSNFTFSEYQLNEFVLNCVVTYLDSASPGVRQTAISTACAIFRNDPICNQTSIRALNSVNDVIDRILQVLITEAHPEIRLEGLSCLFQSVNFDAHLSKAENVKILFVAMNDEVFEVQCMALKILCRLSTVNPAYIVPSLRKALILLLTRLEYANTSLKKEQTAHMLGLLIANPQEITKPYTKPIVEALIPKAKDPSPGVATCAITTLGAAAKVAGEDIKPYLPQLMPLVMSTFQDQSSSFKRLAALKTLGLIASSSGYVIQPLLDYPQLLGMLVGILKSESSLHIRRETVRLLGILGALDPYRHREVEQSEANTNKSLDASGSSDNALPVDIALLMQGMSPTSEEYYLTVAINNLMNILNDTSLSAHHNKAVQAIMYIFQTMGMRCVPFLLQIIPGLLKVMGSCKMVHLKFLLQQLGALVSIVKQHIRPFMTEILQLIMSFHNPAAPIKKTVILLIESIAKALEGEFKMYLADVLPMLLDAIEEDKLQDKDTCMQVLRSFVIFGTNIQEYDHVIIPTVLRLVASQAPVETRKYAIETIGKLARNISLGEMALRIVHPLLRVLNQPGGNAPSNTLTGQEAELQLATINALCSLALSSGDDFIIFVPAIKKVMLRHNIHSNMFENIVGKMMGGEPLPAYNNLYPAIEHSGHHLDAAQMDVPSKKLPVNQHLLKSAWDSLSRNNTKEDWQEWIQRLSKELLKQLPLHAIRACAGLASDYSPLAKNLFNSSFASCWSELYLQHQEELINLLYVALSAPNNLPEIHQILLNLAEFMEHDDKPLPISILTLGQYAQRCHAYAKALHYKELEFYEEPTSVTIEALITINNQLQQSDAAVGILKHAQLHHDLQVKESWHEKLQRWDDALAAYARRLKHEPNNLDAVLGKMRCLHALGEWEQLSELAQERWLSASAETKRNVAPLAAAAAWGLGHWDDMDAYIRVMSPASPDKAFFSAILALHRNSFERASNHILTARDLLVTEITALVSESYNRAYGVVVRVQMLAELEEIIKYKCLQPGLEKRALMRRTWNTRLLGCQRNVDIWQRMLKVRALVISPKQDMEMWIKFANLCRKSGRMSLAENSLNSLLEQGSEHNPSRAPPQVVYAQLKYMWAKGLGKEALRHLVDFTTRMLQDLGLDPDDLITQPVPRDGPGVPKHVEEYTKLLARCFLKQGEWQIVLNSNWRTETSEIILGAFLLATHFDSKWYKAWHNWALANFEVIQLYEAGSIGSANAPQPGLVIELERDSPEPQNGSADADKNATQRNGNGSVPTDPGAASSAPDSSSSNSINGPRDLVLRHVVPSIQGFFHSIALSLSNSLQDTLRLLTLWFKFGGIPEAAQAMADGFGMVKIDNWLLIIPQLISRIHQPNQIVSRSLLGLLTDLGKAHPQALVYPLAVAVTSEGVSRKKAALSIIDKMRLHLSLLVQQSELVLHELIRVAVLWHEQWYEGLEDALRLFFGEHNTEKMYEVLEPLHRMIQTGPQTMREASFASAFSRELSDAYEWVLNYRRTKDISNLNQAWDVYYSVFRRISKQLQQLQTLELAFVSPLLEQARDLQLAVPGSYQAGKPIVRIMKFDSTFTVISSKQRPRKLSCRGSDGKEHQFLLKGHEDIRQDNLVMQLFGLVNTLLVNDTECFKRHLDIQQYPAIPLSPKVGLLGWVPNSDTFHVLIREYRESRKILLNIEHRIMMHMVQEYDDLTILQKVEVFTLALDNTRGQDLYKVLWLKSKLSEAWLDRRTTYTRLLAVMSMVGYILGLGDRHPSNLMLDRFTGKVVHIDFGDCFEAAILREKYPEKVPFRLTRMLNYAMEVSGIEGSFRITCEHVMRVLRANKESLMAILEAFAYDPLINWGFDFPTKAIAETTGIKVHQYNVSELLKAGEIDEQEANRMRQHNALELRNARAALVLRRITDKLTGNDIKRLRGLDIPTQVDKLIQQATSVENLCQHYIGWCSFW
ncbi:hypothetical protein PUMCH_002911 [Australozyma saopauloensis]|uniref:Serine/threonine-protein kinase TOR n=1 Tax=Australozyma saopauloensis TaxID=291208 RepID=A0AAX4HB13_9ASCO|nr:hypothetical protein PUMCH_002911 [[Candida] saopauloensis]